LDVRWRRHSSAVAVVHSSPKGRSIMGGFFRGRPAVFGVAITARSCYLLPQQPSCIANAALQCDSICRMPLHAVLMSHVENTAFVPGKFKFSLQTGVGRCTLLNEPARFRIQARRRGYSASSHQSRGLPFFTETALATGSTSVTADRTEDRKTLRRHEVACVRRAVGMNLTAE